MLPKWTAGLCSAAFLADQYNLLAAAAAADDDDDDEDDDDDDASAVL